MGMEALVTKRALRRTGGAQEAGGTGVAEIVMGPVPEGRLWELGTIAVNGNSAIAPGVEVYIRTTENDWFLDSTPAGNADSASFIGLLLTPYVSLVIRWTGLSAGARVEALVMGREEIL